MSKAKWRDEGDDTWSARAYGTTCRVIFLEGPGEDAVKTWPPFHWMAGRRCGACNTKEEAMEASLNQARRDYERITEQ